MHDWNLKKTNKRVLEKLIKSGAMDNLGPMPQQGSTKEQGANRAALFATLPEAIKAAEQHAKAESLGQNDLFGLINDEQTDSRQSFKEARAWPEDVWLDGEKETLGLYLTGHPINRYLSEIKK